jgi:hypothetical protein
MTDPACRVLLYSTTSTYPLTPSCDPPMLTQSRSWVARDINGTALENAPFEQIFHHQESEHRFMSHLPIQGTSFRLFVRDVRLMVMSSSIMLERYRRVGPGTVLCSEPGQVPNGTINRE